MSLTVPPGLEQIVARGPQHQQVIKGLNTKPEVLPEESVGQHFMTYKQWMDESALDWRRPRSARLKAVDKALKNHENSKYSQDTLRKLRTAINEWIRWKGVDNWKHSARNKNGIVERLRLLAFAPGLPTPMSQEETKAYEVMEEARKKALHTLFKDKRVRLKILGHLKNTKLLLDEIKAGTTDFQNKTRTAWNAVREHNQAKYDAIRHPRNAKGNIRNLVGTGSQAITGIRKPVGSAFGALGKAGKVAGVGSEVFKLGSKTISVGKTIAGVGKAVPLPDFVKGAKDLGGAAQASYDFVLTDLLNLPAVVSSGQLPLDVVFLIRDLKIESIVANFVPFVSLGVGAVGLVFKWGGVAKAAHTLHKQKQCKIAFEKGDPQKAFDAVMKLLKVDLATQSVMALKDTAVFGTQVAGAFADMGAATGPCIAAANAAANLAQKLLYLGIEIIEVIKANKILSDPDKLDFRLFEAYPLAGCYMIRCSTLSDILAMSTIQFGNPGWMDDVELMKKKYIDPLVASCDKFINNSLFEIPDMPKMRNAEDRKKLIQAKQAMKGKSLKGISSEDFR
ncbi:MAG: hypothetical protein AB1916_02325 [Thermodesulfobacteriota bacterium]